MPNVHGESLPVGENKPRITTKPLSKPALPRYLAAIAATLLNPSHTPMPLEHHDPNPPARTAPAVPGKPPVDAVQHEIRAAATGHGDHEHGHGHPDMKKLMDEQLQHPFFSNPEKWLDDNKERIDKECFEPTNEVIVRVPGSGVLEDQDIWVARMAQKAKEMSRAAGEPVKVIIKSHKACGAAGLKFPDDKDPDERAREAQREMVKKLREQGIDAEFGGDSEMNGLPVHNALGVTIDLTRGRMGRSPVNTFVTSTPVEGRLSSDTILTEKIASGAHGYGPRLKDYHAIVFFDPDDIEGSKKIIADYEERAKKELPGIRLHVHRRIAPKAPTGHAPKKMIVICVDERTQQPIDTHEVHH